MESHIFRMCDRIEMISKYNTVGCWGKDFYSQKLNVQGWEQNVFLLKIAQQCIHYLPLKGLHESQTSILFITPQ